MTIYALEPKRRLVLRMADGTSEEQFTKRVLRLCADVGEDDFTVLAVNRGSSDEFALGEDQP